MTINEDRLAKFCSVSSALALPSNNRLDQLLEGTPHNTSIGGENAVIEIADIKVFIKKIPLTVSELLPKNTFSTANLFNLPLNFQYGFSAWRELVAHIVTTNWVLSNE